MSDPPSASPSPAPTSAPISTIAAELPLVREAWELYESLFAKAPVLGFLALGICGSLERAMAKHKVSVWPKAGALVAVAILIAAAIFVGCVVTIVVKRMKRLLVAVDAQVSLTPQPPADLSGARLSDYWLLYAGRTTGPHESNVLRDALEQGDFPPHTLICAIGDKQWLPLSSLRASSSKAAGETAAPISQAVSEA